VNKDGTDFSERIQNTEWKEGDNQKITGYCIDNKTSINKCTNNKVAETKSKNISYIYKLKNDGSIGVYASMVVNKEGKLLHEIHHGDETEKQELYYEFNRFLTNFEQIRKSYDPNTGNFRSLSKGGKRKLTMKNRKRNRRTKKQYSKK